MRLHSAGIMPLLNYDGKLMQFGAVDLTAQRMGRE